MVALSFHRIALTLEQARKTGSIYIILGSILTFVLAVVFKWSLKTLLWGYLAQATLMLLLIIPMSILKMALERRIKLPGWKEVGSAVGAILLWVFYTQIVLLLEIMISVNPRFAGHFFFAQANANDVLLIASIFVVEYFASIATKYKSIKEVDHLDLGAYFILKAPIFIAILFVLIGVPVVFAFLSIIVAIEVTPFVFGLLILMTAVIVNGILEIMVNNGEFHKGKVVVEKKK